MVGIASLCWHRWWNSSQDIFEQWRGQSEWGIVNGLAKWQALGQHYFHSYSSLLLIIPYLLFLSSPVVCFLKLRELFGPKKAVCKQKSWSYHVFNKRTTKRIAKFEGLEPQCCKDIKGTVAPEMCTKSFGTFEKWALGLNKQLLWKRWVLVPTMLCWVEWTITLSCPMGSPYWRVKSSGVRQSKIHKSANWVGKE